MIASAARRIAVTCTVLGLAAIGVAAAPKPAYAWWHGYGWGVGIYVPPVVVASPPITLRPPPAGSQDTGKEITGCPVIGRETVTRFISNDHLPRQSADNGRATT